MSPATIVTLVLLAGGASALRRGRRYDLITPRPYNNRYNDATAARDEHAMTLG